jgi:hypothetical protein
VSKVHLAKGLALPAAELARLIHGCGADLSIADTFRTNLGAP